MWKWTITRVPLYKIFAYIESSFENINFIVFNKYTYGMISVMRSVTFKVSKIVNSEIWECVKWQIISHVIPWITDVLAFTMNTKAY